MTITSPANGARIGTSVTINATATDAGGVSAMQVLIDNQLRASSTVGSISYTWSTRNVSRGTHTITVRATDAAGNVGTRSISVTR